MSPSIKVATCNALKLLTKYKAIQLLSDVLPQADVVVWQELRSVHKAALRARPGWAHYFARKPWGLGISWRTDRFRVVQSGVSRVSVAANPRLHDPTRGYAYVVLQDVQSGKIWPVVTTHMTHQAFTSHPERRPRWHLEAARLALRSRRLTKRYERMVGGGDMNRHKWTPKGTIGTWARHGTYGDAKYDTLFHKGQVLQVGAGRRILTPSDHDALVTTYVARG